MLIYSELGVLLAQLMAAHENMSGAELARRLGGIDRSSVGRWKTGQERPEPETVVKIADLFGYDRIELLKLARYLPGEPQPQPDPSRKIKHEKLDAWLIAVGTDLEPLFWDALVAEGDSLVALIERLKTAVSDGLNAAVSGAVSASAAHAQRRKRTRRGPLTAHQHPQVASALVSAASAIIASAQLAA